MGEMVNGIMWVPRGLVIFGFVGDIYAFRIVVGDDKTEGSVLESRLPGTYEDLGKQRDTWDKDIGKLKILASVLLEEFCRKAGLQ